MSSERGKPIAISLRLRVAAWIAGAVVLTSAVLLAVIREGVRQALLHELDASLQADAGELLLERDQHLADPSLVHEIMRSQARAHREAQWFAQLLADDGHALFSTATTPTDFPLPPLRGSGKPETISGFRVLERRPAESQAVVRVGISLSAIDSDMARIDRLVGGAALGMFLAAPLTGFLLATITLRPITEMRERTAQLRPQQLDARLPLTGTGDELDHLATVINHLLARIAQYVGDHRGIMADAAHQLRTPLAAIRSSVEVVLTTDENSAENRELLAKVIEQIESLETLVNQLLLLAETEVENLRLDTQHVSLDEIVRRSLDMFEAVAESRGVTLQIGAIDPAEIQGNRHFLRQVVNNLIDNAIKFTAIKEEGPRQISIELLRRDHQGIAQLKIADTGIGMKPEHLAHIFGRFYRIDRARRSDGGVGGNGLGLSIVKSVVESHGGEVNVESTEGVGTTFTIRLPLAKSEAMLSA